MDPAPGPNAALLPSGLILRRCVAPTGIPGPIDGMAGPDKPIAHIGAGHVATSHNSPVSIPINLGTGYHHDLR